MPNITGLWQSKRTKVLQQVEPNQIKFIPVTEARIDIQQQGDFIVFKQLNQTLFRQQNSTRLGVWQEGGKQFLLSDDVDNSISFIKVRKERNGVPVQLTYNYIQSGYNSGGKQTVVKSKLVRVNSLEI